MEEININQTPVSQPNISDLPVQNNKNIYKYLFFIAIIVLLGVVVGFYFLLNNKINKLETKKNIEITPTIEEISTIPTKTEVTPTAIPTTKSTESTLIEKDASNNLYTNNKVGFSLILPKTIEINTCQKSDDSYGLGGSEKTILNFFENGDIIYLAGNYFYNVTGGETTSKGNYIYTGCQRIESTFNSVDQKAAKGGVDALKVYAANVKNESELLQFIKSKYGSACRLGEKVTGEGDFSIVKILGDGKPLDESNCQSNGVKVSYSSTKNKVVIFEIGQAYEPLDGVSKSLNFF